MLAAVRFSAVCRDPAQRYVIHKERNVMSAIPKRECRAVTAELTRTWKAQTKEEIGSLQRQIP